MGYRGLVAEQNRGRDLRAESWTLQDRRRVGVAKSPRSRLVRDVELVPAPRSTARRRGPTPCSAASRPEIDELGRGPPPHRSPLRSGVPRRRHRPHAGEGSKTEGEVRFANSDPRMVEAFCAWLRHFFEIDEVMIAHADVSARRTRSRRDERALVDADGHSGPSVPHALPPCRIRRSALPSMSTAARWWGTLHPDPSGGSWGLLQHCYRARPSFRVAQLAERRTVNAIVVGSSPTPSTIGPTSIGRGSPCFP